MNDIEHMIQKVQAGMHKDTFLLTLDAHAASKLVYDWSLLERRDSRYRVASLNEGCIDEIQATKNSYACCRILMQLELEALDGMGFVDAYFRNALALTIGPPVRILHLLTPSYAGWHLYLPMPTQGLPPLIMPKEN